MQIIVPLEKKLFCSMNFSQLLLNLLLSICFVALSRLYPNFLSDLRAFEKNFFVVTQSLFTTAVPSYLKCKTFSLSCSRNRLPKTANIYLSHRSFDVPAKRTIFKAQLCFVALKSRNFVLCFHKG